MRRFRRKAELFSDIYEAKGVGIMSSIRQYNDKIVSRYCGFRDANDHYCRVANARVIGRIAVPAPALCAAADPLIRPPWPVFQIADGLQ